MSPRRARSLPEVDTATIRGKVAKLIEPMVALDPPIWPVYDQISSGLILAAGLFTLEGAAANNDGVA